MKVWELLVVLLLTIYLAYTFIIYIGYIKSRNLGNKITFMEYTSDTWEHMTIIILIGITFITINYFKEHPEILKILTREVF